MKKAYLLICLAALTVGFSNATWAQGSEKKMDALINALEETSFIQEYKQYKSEVEAKVVELKITDSLNVKDVAKVKIAYNQSKFKFDAIVEQLRRDLSNAATRKLIEKSPTAFSNAYQKKLDNAKTYCNNNFHLKADDLLKIESAPDVETLELLISSFFTIFKTIGDKRKAADEFNTAYLETQLIEPLRFKAWEKIE